MKILIAAVHYPVASGRYIQRALVRLGHDVRTAGPSTGNQIWGISVDMRHVWQPSLTCPLGADGWLPDLVITADSGFLMLGDVPRPHVIWGVDNHVRDYWPEDAEKFDALFLAHSWGARMGEPNVHWLPAAYDPAVHFDEGGDRPYEVVIAAVPYGPRAEIVQALRQAGLDVWAGIGALWDDYRRFYNAGKIALVKSACGDLSQRFLEGMAMGCCVLADRTVDAEKLGFLAGVDYWPYATPAEAVESARYLLATGEWARIAANGQRKVQGHTWDARAEQMLETVAAMAAERASQ